MCNNIGKRVLFTENAPKSGLMGERKRSGVIQWNKCEILVIQNNGMNLVMKQIHELSTAQTLGRGLTVGWGNDWLALGNGTL